MHDENPRHPGEDGEVYEIDMVIHDKYTSFEYDVDLVRWTEDDHGLPRSQRLTLDTHTAYGLAEEHQMGVDIAITELGLEDAIGKQIAQVKEQPFEPVTYDVMTLSEDMTQANTASLLLIAVQEGQFNVVTLAEGAHNEMEHLAMGLEDIQAEHGSDKLLEASHQVAVDQGILEPNQTLFNGLSSLERTVEAEYSINAVSANDEHFLDVTKTWGENEYEQIVIPQPTWDEALTIAETAFDLQADGDLQGAMTLIEQTGIEAGVIDPQRDDPRLFTQGPDDPFVTQRETEIDDDLARYGVTWRESQDWETAAPEIPTVENPYWQFDTLPVQDPEGEALGVSLQMVRFPTIDQEVRSEITPDTPLEMLEVGQFDTVHQANEFATEFSSYLSPGILEGPELAEALVGKLETEPVTWKTLDETERAAYQESTLILTYDRSDWSPSPDVEDSNPVMAPDFDL